MRKERARETFPSVVVPSRQSDCVYGIGVISTGGESGARMTDMTSVAPSKTTVAMGVLSMAVGIVPLLAMSGILPRPTSPQADPAPLWMGWLIGAAFVGAGLNVIMRGILGGASESSGELP